MSKTATLVDYAKRTRRVARKPYCDELDPPIPRRILSTAREGFESDEKQPSSAGTAVENVFNSGTFHREFYTTTECEHADLVDLLIESAQKNFPLIITETKLVSQQPEFGALWVPSSPGGYTAWLRYYIRFLTQSDLRDDPRNQYANFSNFWIKRKNQAAAIWGGQESLQESPPLDPQQGQTEAEIYTGEDFWAIVKDAHAEIERRVEALNELHFEEPDSVANFIVDELEREGLSARWRNTMILAAEMVQFTDEQLRNRLTQRLYDLASTLLHSTATEMKPIVQSAIRTYVSMIRPEQAETLLPFLEPPKPIETRLVTLLCVTHRFQVQPPDDTTQHENLSNRIHELAVKFLDRDWLVAGEKAALGQNATCALAALGDSRLNECVEKIQQLEMKWLTRQVKRKLMNLLEAWSQKSDVMKHPAAKLVKEQLGKLEHQD